MRYRPYGYEQMSFFIISQSKTWKAADDWLELNPAEEGWELAEFHKERFASPGASLKGLNLHGCTWQTDKLNRQWLDGERIRQSLAGWVELRSAAKLDHLLGNAGLERGGLAHQVGHSSWLDQGVELVIESNDIGWDNGLHGTGHGLLFQFLQEWGRDS